VYAFKLGSLINVPWRYAWNMRMHQALHGLVLANARGCQMLAGYEHARSRAFLHSALVNLGGTRALVGIACMADGECLTNSILSSSVLSSVPKSRIAQPRPVAVRKRLRGFLESNDEHTCVLNLTDVVRLICGRWCGGRARLALADRCRVVHLDD